MNKLIKHQKPNSFTHTFHPDIIRANDIRGTYGDELTDNDAYAIGRAFVPQIGPNARIAVCRDGRQSSPALLEALINGILDAGGTVLRLGVGPTPMMYYAMHVLKADGGIMVTGSHNPADQNGFKLMQGKTTFHGEQLRNLALRVQKGKCPFGVGQAFAAPIHAAYLEEILRAAPQHSTLKVVWDPGHGATADVITQLVDRLPGDHKVINGTIDARFPSHHPDPTVPENLEQLINEVLEGGYDMGIAFDGDGDRLGMVDQKGRIIWGDQMLSLLAREILQKHPGTPVIADVKASQTLFDVVSAAGGVPIMWKTGHAFIKGCMRDKNALLAGEMSGHIFIGDEYFGYDDGAYTALRMIRLVEESGQSLKSLVDQLPTAMATQELRIPCDESQKVFKIEAAKALLAGSGLTLNTIDGLRVTSPDGWWLLRASNTQAVLVARAEGRSMTALDKVTRQLIDVLTKLDLTIPPEIVDYCG